MISQQDYFSPQSHKRKRSIYCNTQFSFSHYIYITIISFTAQQHQIITKHNIICKITTHKWQHGSYWCGRVKVLYSIWEPKMSPMWQQQSQSFSFYLTHRQAHSKACTSTKSIHIFRWKKKIQNQFLWIVLHSNWKPASLITRLMQPNYFCFMFRDRRTSLQVHNNIWAWDSRASGIYVTNGSPQHSTQRG